MSDPVRRLTAELAANPSSLVFLELAEELRRRGQTGAAWKVARAGLGRYPELTEAHDLCARILADQGERAAAREAWQRVLELSPGHLGALKGLAFLAYRAGRLSEARAHLETAASVAPGDTSVHAALARLFEAPPVPESEPVPAAAPPPPALDLDHASDTLLLDAQGLRLAGELRRADGDLAGDIVAAELAGVTRECARAARLLDLGPWQHLSAESPDGTMLLVAPTPSTALFVTREASVPVGRLALIAEQAARAARAWLERMA